jgi:hypothetical protein
VRLVDRIRTSEMVEDRRSAMGALKDLSTDDPGSHPDIGAAGMEVLVAVLRTDVEDPDIVRDALETLTNITTMVQRGTAAHIGGGESVGLQNTKLFVKRPENVACLIDLLSLHDFHARFATVQLMTALLTNSPDDLQEGIMSYPAGVPRLMDVAKDERQEIRDAALLLLVQLTRYSAELQKAVVFDGGFDLIFEIVGATFHQSADGVVVADCLELTLNLLRENASNQNYFRENGDFSRLAAAMRLPRVQNFRVGEGSSEALLKNIVLMLDVATALVSPPAATGQPSKDLERNRQHFGAGAQTVRARPGRLSGLSVP